MESPTQPSCCRAVKWTWQQYPQYLQSFDWIFLRNRVFAKFGMACQACGRKVSVQCHHLRYREHPEDSIPDDLMPLCQRCHTEVHRVFTCPMSRKAVLGHLRRSKRVVVVDKAWRKAQRRPKPPKPVRPSRKQRRKLIKEEKKKFRNKWSFLISRHPELYKGVR